MSGMSEHEEPEREAHPETPEEIEAWFDAQTARIWAIAQRHGLPAADMGAAYLYTRKELWGFLQDSILGEANPELYETAWEVRMLFDRVAGLRADHPPALRARLRELAVVLHVDPERLDWKRQLSMVDEVLGGRSFDESWRDDDVRTTLRGMREQYEAERAQRSAEDVITGPIYEDLYGYLKEVYGPRGDGRELPVHVLAWNLAQTAVWERSALSTRSIKHDLVRDVTDCGIPLEDLPGLQRLARQILAQATIGD